MFKTLRQCKKKGQCWWFQHTQAFHGSSYCVLRNVFHLILICWATSEETTSAHLKNLYDLEFGVHDQDVLFLGLCGGLHRASILGGRRGQREEAPSPQHHLSHQLPHAVDGAHDVTAYTHTHIQNIRLDYPVGSLTLS